MIAALVVLALALVAALIKVALTHRRLTSLARQTHDVVRDHAPRVRGGGEVERWINALAEDAERGRAALAHERTLLAAVADGLTQGVIVIDGEHRIELLNDAACKMLDVQRSLVGEPLFELVRIPELREFIDRPDDSVLEVELPSGARALIRAARTLGHAGRVLLLEDVTTVRRLESVRRDIVANVSHELRSPVAVIRANAETLMAGAKDDPQMAAKLVEGLHRNAERLARILADMLDLSRLDAGQYRLEVGRVMVKSVTEQSLSAVETQAEKRGVTLSIDIPDGLAVRADAKALDQILVNLLDNGVKYTETRVWIEAREVGDAVRIEARDDGPGLADKHRERVFERFYRADPSRSREAGGTGLGLSIVKHLVESMGGAVGVEPNQPRGSVFWIRLPKAATLG